jgi:hypothetical protein
MELMFESAQRLVALHAYLGFSLFSKDIWIVSWLLAFNFAW